MKDTIILVTDKNMVKNVYASYITDKFLIMDENDLYSSSIDTTKVKYILSTWYLPNISEIDIKKYLPSLKYVFYAAGDSSYFEKNFLNSNVRVINAKDLNGKSVADFVFGQILLANKGYFNLENKYRRSKLKIKIGKIQSIIKNYSGNYNAKIGLLGFGSVARQLSKLLLSLEFEVYVYDPYIQNNVFKEYGVKGVSFEEIFSKCEIVSNHLPDIDETQKIINIHMFKLMPKYGTFINTGRGSQVVEKDILKFAKKNKNFTFLLDVTAHEPLIPMHPLYFQKNVLITPHIAGSHSNEKIRMGDYIYKKYLEIREDKNNEDN